MNRRSFFGRLLGLAILPFVKTKERRAYPIGTQWTNYTSRYTDISKEELLAAMCKAKKHTVFYPPLEES